MFYNSSDSYEYNDCISRGACSVSPNIFSMQEVMFLLLRQIAFYLVKLKSFGIEKQETVSDVLNEIAFIDALKDFSEAQILNSFSKQYVNLVKSRKEYLKICKEKEVKCEDLKNLIKLSPKTNLSAILKLGDKGFIKKNKNIDSDKKYLIYIMSGVMKSVCINTIALNEYGENCMEAANTVIDALNLFNRTRISAEIIKENIDALCVCDVELLRLLNKAQMEAFGLIEQVNVSLSTRPNKVIMVSGSDLNDLKSLLDFVKDTDIDVYTNGNLMIAHAFPYFKQFKNLRGHFGSGVFNTILDFATFPGAILLTKNESQNIEYLYRGRLFTTDEITPKGVMRIENNNFSTLVESALQAKGFAKGRERESEIIGFDSEKLDEMIDKILAKNPEKIIIIGFSNLSVKQKDYFSKFYSMLPANYQVITFSYNPMLDNVLSINIGNDYALLYGVLHKIFEKIPVNSDKLSFFLTKCDINSLSNIITLKNNGAKSIFLSDCPPPVINPALLKEFNKMYNIQTLTNPKEDLKILGNKNG